MNSFDLIVQDAASGSRVLALVPIIDGRPFNDLVTEFELARGFDIVGGYDGIVPANYRFGPLSSYYLGLEDGWGPSIAAVLGCECGEVGCWPALVTITSTVTSVIWSNFEQPHRPDRDYSDFGSFEFERQTYEHAVRSATAALSAGPF